MDIRTVSFCFSFMIMEKLKLSLQKRMKGVLTFSCRICALSPSRSFEKPSMSAWAIASIFFNDTISEL